MPDTNSETVWDSVGAHSNNTHMLFTISYRIPNPSKCVTTWTHMFSNALSFVTKERYFVRHIMIICFSRPLDEHGCYMWGQVYSELCFSLAKTCITARIVFLLFSTPRLKSYTPPTYQTYNFHLLSVTCVESLSLINSKAESDCYYVTYNIFL